MQTNINFRDWETNQVSRQLFIEEETALGSREGPVQLQATLFVICIPAQSSM